eukprot:3731961-Amphidinium_carterae.1
MRARAHPMRFCHNLGVRLGFVRHWLNDTLKRLPTMEFGFNCKHSSRRSAMHKPAAAALIYCQRWSVFENSIAINAMLESAGVMQGLLSRK